MTTRATAKEIMREAVALLLERCRNQKTYVVAIYDPDTRLCEIGFSLAPEGALQVVDFARERIARMIETKES